MMSAPKSLSSIEQYGPARMRERSRTRIPSSGFTTSRLMMRACRGKRFPLQARHANLPAVAGNGYARARRCRLDERSRGYDSGARAGERPMKDFPVKARLFVTRELVVPINVLVKNSATEARTVYRSDKTQLLVVQPAHGAPRYYRQGVGELTGDQQLDRKSVV